uniref:Mername AA168 protein M67 family n=1 Tax=Echinococcus granulosus TaxID=6210 RepID=A0A068WPJ0_ECHGR|nr:Mername AA168 protein M67 family [Echinococcus granulosus]
MASNKSGSSKTARDREAESFLRAEKRISSSLLAVLPATLVGSRVCVTLLDDTRITGLLTLGLFAPDVNCSIVLILAE